MRGSSGQRDKKRFLKKGSFRVGFLKGLRFKREIVEPSRLGQGVPWEWTIRQDPVMWRVWDEKGNNEKQSSPPEIFLPSLSICLLAHPFFHASTPPPCLCSNSTLLLLYFYFLFSSCIFTFSFTFSFLPFFFLVGRSLNTTVLRPPTCLWYISSDPWLVQILEVSPHLFY